MIVNIITNLTIATCLGVIIFPIIHLLYYRNFYRYKSETFEFLRELNLEYYNILDATHDDFDHCPFEKPTIGKQILNYAFIPGYSMGNGRIKFKVIEAFDENDNIEVFWLKIETKILTKPLLTFKKQ